VLELLGRAVPFGVKQGSSTLKGASEVDSDQFDTVFIANGKYSEPYIPRIAGT
jgi:cation diffusion facilitator CzcD-associated flavoprotein CzcO